MKSVDTIKIAIPPKPDYVATVRLAAGAVADRVGFNIEQIEDIRTAIAEACIMLINQINDDHIDITFEVGSGFTAYASADITDIDEELSAEAEFSSFMLSAMMDEVDCADNDGHREYTLKKYL